MAPRRPALTVLAIALLVPLAVSCGGSSAPVARPSGSATTSVAADPAYLTARVALGTKPCGIVAAGARVWVSNYGDGTLQWIDRATGAASPPVEVGRQPCGVAVGGGSVWVENYGSNDLTRVDEETGKVRATVRVGVAPYDVAYAAGAAWVTDFADGTVSRVDARTDKRTVVRTGGQPAGIAPLDGAVWVALSDSGRVLRIDTKTAKVTDRLDIGTSAVWTAYTGHDLWVTGTSADGTGGTVTRIDTLQRRVVATVDVGPKPADGVAVGDDVFVPDQTGDIYRIDAGSNTVLAHVASGVGDPFVVTGTDGELWAADFQGTEAVRLDVTRLPGG